MVLENFDDYVEKHKLDNPVVLIAGHSLGGAVSNLVANELIGREGIENIFAYTFATPNATNDVPIIHQNIFNIINKYDFVPLIPPSASFLALFGVPNHEIPTYAFDKHGRSAIIDMFGTTYLNVANNHLMGSYLDWDDHYFDVWEQLPTSKYFWEE